MHSLLRWIVSFKNCNEVKHGLFPPMFLELFFYVCYYHARASQTTNKNLHSQILRDFQFVKQRLGEMQNSNEQYFSECCSGKKICPVH